MELILINIIVYFSGFWGAVELAGTIFSIICVVLAARHNQWTWFFGALGVICFGFLFFEFTLYSDAGLQFLFFLPLQLWGFIYWRKLSSETNNPVVTKSLALPQIYSIVFAIIALALINGFLMTTFTTDVSFPYMDAFTTWMSVFAQILMIGKYWQSWAIWTSMNIMAIYIYFAKGLFVVSGLYVVFLIIAIFGMIKWRQDYLNSQKQKVID